MVGFRVWGVGFRIWGFSAQGLGDKEYGSLETQA